MQSEERGIEYFLGTELSCVIEKPIVTVDEVRFHPQSTAGIGTVTKVMPRICELAQKGFHSFFVKVGRGGKETIGYFGKDVPSIWEELLALTYMGSVEQTREYYAENGLDYENDVAEVKQQYIDGSKENNRHEMFRRLAKV